MRWATSACSTRSKRTGLTLRSPSGCSRRLPTNQLEANGGTAPRDHYEGQTDDYGGVRFVLGSKVVGYAVFVVFGVFTLSGPCRLITPPGWRELEKKVTIEGQDKALR